MFLKNPIHFAAICLVFFSNLTLLSHASFASIPPVLDSGIALIFDGDGVCKDECALSLAHAARVAGFTPKIITAADLDEESSEEEVKQFFEGVKVWIQPGGYAKEASISMGAKLRQGLIDFIRQGGGYVGFCAGMFLTTSEIGSTGVQGLGIFPGKTAAFNAPVGDPRYQFSIEPIQWFGVERQIYFEGGPFLYDLPSSVEIVAYYKDGKSVASARTTFGKGRVFVSGPHPEAPQWWSEGTLAPDRDGSDLFLAVDMILWAGRGEQHLLVAGF